MACNIPPSQRDLLVRLFRAEVYRRSGFVEFPPQADFRLATEGYTLTPQVVQPPQFLPPPYDPEKVRLDDYPIVSKPVQLMVPSDPDDPDSFEVGETGNWAKYQWQLAVPRRHLMPIRGKAGEVEIKEGVVAHKASALAAFKNGKSRLIGMWLAGFACLPGATIDLVGLNYSTSEHEFEYLREALMSGTKPFVQKSHIKHNYNDVKQGRMLLELTNGCSFAVRSWLNKDTLRGGQITCYCFNEIYQLPGLEVFTGHAQNLRVEKGFAAFTSTPDRPWVKILHQMGHGHNPDWHCTCDNDALVNPFSFDLTGMLNDLPDWETLQEHAPHLMEMAQSSGLQPGKLMSKEKFLISWLGRMGGFVGRVYNFNREQITCYPSTHPHLFKKEVVEEWASLRDQIDELRDAALA